MKERIIIESNMTYLKRLRNSAIFYLGLEAIILVLARVVNNALDDVWDKIWDSSVFSSEYKMLSAKIDMLDPIAELCLYAELIFGVIALFLLIFYFIHRKTSLTVTDKRVFGKTAFGKQVDLPLDSVSAISTGAFKSIAVATASGHIKFIGISNRDEIRKELSNLLQERQNSKTESAKVVVEKAASNDMASELKSIKELLDSGIISQEEFDAKKKQLLGL